MQPHHPPPPQIPGRLVDDQNKAYQLKRHVASLCGVEHTRFVGSQPVSFGARDIARLEREDYWVCEKSDGIRVLVLIVNFASTNDQEVYLIDRRNEYRQQDGLFFPHPMDPRRALGNTLLDAELVTDYDPETKQETLNLLAFDCIVGDGQNLMPKSLTSRYGRLKEWVIKPYQKMLQEHPSMKSSQPFEIHEKEMQRSYTIEMVLETIPNLKHGNDGLIFTCAESGYVIGTDHRILKWKPPSENSIDFKLELRFPPLPERPSEPDFTAKPVFQLLIWTGSNSYEHFDVMQVDDAQWESWKASGEQYDDRVVEVTWDGTTQNWIYHRFRDDKEHGNHQSVVDKILESIRDGVEALVGHANLIRTNWKEREKTAASSHYPPQGGYPPSGHYGAPPYSHGGPAFVAGLRR
ncbi:mRNA capping enzyme, catalytic domain-containing protein [Rhizoctonia solani]|nr:mRNA capping enzyme, catalytic domain-containing protein [Rhizoctonia solani]